MIPTDLTPYMDTYGFIGHIDDAGQLEFGDGIRELSTYYISLYTLEPENRIDNGHDFAKQLAKVWVNFQDSEGKRKDTLLRHPDITRWWGAAWNTSGDQVHAAIKCLTLYRPYSDACKVFLETILNHLWSRVGFCYNWHRIWPDYTFDEPKLPDNRLLSLFEWTIRGLRLWWAWPLLLIFDLIIFINTLARIWEGWFFPVTTHNDPNLQQDLMVGQEVLWSPIVWLAKYFYIAFRRAPKLPGETKRMEGYAPQLVWDAYYHGPKSPPMNEYAQYIVEEYI